MLNALMELVVRKDPESVHWLTLNMLAEEAAKLCVLKHGMYSKQVQAMESEPVSSSSLAGFLGGWKAGSPAKPVTEADLYATARQAETQKGGAPKFGYDAVVRLSEIDNTDGKVTRVEVPDIAGHYYGEHVVSGRNLTSMGGVIGEDGKHVHHDGYIVDIEQTHGTLQQGRGTLLISANPWHTGKQTKPRGMHDEMMDNLVYVNRKNVSDYREGQHVTIRDESSSEVYSGFIQSIQHHVPDRITGPGMLTIYKGPWKSKGVIEVDPHTGGRTRTPEAPAPHRDAMSPSGAVSPDRMTKTHPTPPIAPNQHMHFVPAALPFGQGHWQEERGSPAPSEKKGSRFRLSPFR
jgi:hypothetical protein